MLLRDRRVRLAALVATVGVLAVLNVLAARGTTRTITTVTTPAGASATGEPAAFPVDLPTRGARLFEAKGCATCHVEVGIGPDLADVGKRAGASRPGLDAEQYLRESILEPAAYRAPAPHGATAIMPTLPVSDVELRALVAYLLTL